MLLEIIHTLINPFISSSVTSLMYVAGFPAHNCLSGIKVPTCIDDDKDDDGDDNDELWCNYTV